MLLPELQALAYNNLRSLFTWIDSHIANSSGVPNLIMLARYVHENTSRLDEAEEPLQKLITTLIALDFIGFHDGEEEDVRRLMDEGGDFATDVWEKISRHMGVLEKEARELRMELDAEKREKDQSG